MPILFREIKDHTLKPNNSGRIITFIETSAKNNDGSPIIFEANQHVSRSNSLLMELPTHHTITTNDINKNILIPSITTSLITSSNTNSQNNSYYEDGCLPVPNKKKNTSSSAPTSPTSSTSPSPKRHPPDSLLINENNNIENKKEKKASRHKSFIISTQQHFANMFRRRKRSSSCGQISINLEPVIIDDSYIMQQLQEQKYSDPEEEFSDENEDWDIPDSLREIDFADGLQIVEYDGILINDNSQIFPKIEFDSHKPNSSILPEFPNTIADSKNNSNHLALPVTLPLPVSTIMINQEQSVLPEEISETHESFFDD
ncbi:7866_t:CDS:2 [Ambispora gerdemannii]|uniref:7866_t:CDS:1 n=1 Tax=Ambispora gerdemannii TaxID=144530 RepID=A0A9N8V131_9GLOM|nr:7866_t:CDS:2 [Ambispora gerdemannii]